MCIRNAVDRAAVPSMTTKNTEDMLEKHNWRTVHI